MWLPEFVHPGSCGKWPCCISAKISVVLKFYRGLCRLFRSVTRRNLEQSTAAFSRTVILFVRFFSIKFNPLLTLITSIFTQYLKKYVQNFFRHSLKIIGGVVRRLYCLLVSTAVELGYQGQLHSDKQVVPMRNVSRSLN